MQKSKSRAYLNNLIVMDTSADVVAPNCVFIKGELYQVKYVSLVLCISMVTLKDSNYRTWLVA